MGSWVDNGNGTSVFTTNSGVEIAIQNGLLQNGSLVDTSISDINSNHPSYHEYKVLSNLGFNQEDVNVEVVRNAFFDNPTPTGIFFAGPGFVSHYSPNPNTVVNVTTDFHVLDPGVTQRQIIIVDGQFFIQTTGMGIGVLPEQNIDLASLVWGQADVSVMTSIHAQTGIGPNMSVAGVVGTIEPQCFLAGTEVTMADGAVKPIEDIRPDDWVQSFDEKTGELKPGRVKRTFTNEAKIILDFHGTFVTPGHVYYCAEGKFANKFAPLIDILRDDGAVQLEEGPLVRAATGCEVGSKFDTQFWAFKTTEDADGNDVIQAKTQLRLGTRWMLPNGHHFNMQEFMDGNGIELLDDGYVLFKDTGLKTPFIWTFSESLPNPEDFVLARSQTSLEEIYRAGQWESTHPSMPIPLQRDSGAVTPVAEHQLDALPRNMPMAFESSAVSSTMSVSSGLNRKQRKAQKAKARTAVKHAGKTLH